MSQTSPCHQAPIDLSRGDGIMIGSCSQCGKDVAWINPETNAIEWLALDTPPNDNDLPTS